MIFHCESVPPKGIGAPFDVQRAGFVTHLHSYINELTFQAPFGREPPAPQ